MKIAVLGNNGMLGHVIEKVFKRELAEVNGFGRDMLDVYPRKLNDMGAKLSMIMERDTDYVINCIGAIKPTFEKATD